MKINYPETILNKPTGSTQAEKYLYQLCQHSFLSMWSFSNIYRDQAKKGLNGDGKEVCDLLVVFEKHIIIFSDKDCSFPIGPDLNLNWTRWYRKAIFQSANQIFGAEKWLLERQDRIYIDKNCKTKFPIRLPPPDQVKVHRIVVAHGVSDHCAKYFGGSGSLLIDTNLNGSHNLDLKQCRPFTIGNAEPDKRFVHILDDTTLKILMSSLDTITDFVKYLTAKEQYLSGGTQILASGEEQLLATYMTNIDDSGEHVFPVPDDINDLHVFGEGLWEDFQQSNERRVQLMANRISYFWDDLIEKFVGHIFGGTSEHLSSVDIKEHEKALRILARENRTRRRMLADAFIEILNKTQATQRSTRTIIPTEEGCPCYVFLFLPRTIDDESQYRALRRELLKQYCIVAKLRTQMASEVIGLATEPRSSETRSEDIVLVDVSNWTEQDKANAQMLERDLKENGLRAEAKWLTSEVYEFPVTPRRTEKSVLKGKDRNKPCFCGSRLKFKFCCGKN